MTATRLVYDGRPGVRSLRSLGAFAFYSSSEGPVRIWSDGRWSEAVDVALVEPFTQHLVAAGDRITELLLEVETVAAEELLAFWRALERDGRRAFRDKIAEAAHNFRADPGLVHRDNFDRLFLGMEMTERTLDPRIVIVVERICSTPNLSVKELAGVVGLSPSRLTHSFIKQLGTNMRRFRAWKRARMVMPIALEHDNLLSLALEAGYADASHFSHSIRSFFGLRARDLCEGSRRANVSTLTMLGRGCALETIGLVA